MHSTGEFFQPVRATRVRFILIHYARLCLRAAQGSERSYAQFMLHFVSLTRRLVAACALCGIAWALPAAAQEGVVMRSDAAAKPATVAPGLDPAARALAESGSKAGTLDVDYKITPSDLLEIEVFGVSELKRTVRVNTSGQIAMPLIGTVTVAGLTPADAEALIALQYSGKNFLQDPQVSIFVKEFTTQRITLDGALAKPGVYPLTGQITLLRALAMAGGGGQLADMENVMLFRLTPEGKSEMQKYDVLKIRKGEAPDPMLQNDDVVVVNRNESRVTLRDSLFRDIIDTLNPFSASYRNATAPQ